VENKSQSRGTLKRIPASQRVSVRIKSYIRSGLMHIGTNYESRSEVNETVIADSRRSATKDAYNLNFDGSASSDA